MILLQENGKFMGRPRFYVWKCGLLNLNFLGIFDIKKGIIDESKRPNKVFYKEDIFDEELEKIMNFNIESRVANILNNKIGNNEDIRLTRDE